MKNVLDILVNCFRALLTTLQQDPETVVIVIQACVCLHNLMRELYPALQNVMLDIEDQDHNLIPGVWRKHKVLEKCQVIRGGNWGAKEAKRQRVYLKHYYNGIGAREWQQHMM